MKECASRTIFLLRHRYWDGVRLQLFALLAIIIAAITATATVPVTIVVAIIVAIIIAIAVAIIVAINIAAARPILSVLLPWSHDD